MTDRARLLADIAEIIQRDHWWDCDHAWGCDRGGYDDCAMVRARDVLDYLATSGGLIPATSTSKTIRVEYAGLLEALRSAGFFDD